MISRKPEIRMIAVTFQKPGVHQYPAAPDDVQYLRAPHRHLFKFKVKIQVWHDDREIEFHQFLNWVEGLYSGEQSLSLNNSSCEMISDSLAAIIQSRYPDRLLQIEVWEDGECGSVSSYSAMVDRDQEGESESEKPMEKGEKVKEWEELLSKDEDENLVPVKKSSSTKITPEATVVPAEKPERPKKKSTVAITFSQLSRNEQLHLLLSQKIEPSEVFDISDLAIQTLIDETCRRFKMLKPLCKMEEMCVGHSGGKDSVLVRALADLAGFGSLDTVHNPKLEGSNAVHAHTRELLYEMATFRPVMHIPAHAMAKSGYRLQIDGTRRQEATRTDGRSTDIVCNGQSMNRAQMPMLVPRGLFDMTFFYPIVEWTDAQVWAAIAYLEIPFSREYSNFDLQLKNMKLVCVHQWVLMTEYPPHYARCTKCGATK